MQALTGIGGRRRKSSFLFILSKRKAGERVVRRGKEANKKKKPVSRNAEKEKGSV